MKDAGIDPPKEIAKRQPEQLRRFVSGVLDPPSKEDFADRSAMRGRQ